MLSTLMLFTAMVHTEGRIKNESVKY